MDRADDFYGMPHGTLVRDCAPMFRLIDPDDIERVNETIRASAQTMKPWHCEWRYATI